MRLDKAWIVATKDWEEIFRSKITLVSVILPFVVPLALPLFIITLYRYFGEDIGRFISKSELELLADVFPKLRDIDPNYAIIYLICVLVVPLLYIVFSLASISIVTADSFAGEKERGTIEALFATPLSDLELFIGKLLASFIPSILLTYSFFIITVILVNLATLDYFGGFWYPQAEVAIAVLIIAPLYAFLGMTLVIWGSSRVSTVRDSSNYAGILVIPVLVFVIGVSVGALVISLSYLVIFSVILVIVDLLALYICYKTFDRERLMISV